MADDPLHVKQQKSAAPFARLVGSSRYIVLLAVAGVLLVAVSLFAMGTIHSFTGVYDAWKRTLGGDADATVLTVEFLELVGIMLKAVAFYIVAVGLYSLFIAPLNVAVSLGVESLHDLENKVISVAIVIMAVTFLEHFVRWESGEAMLQFGASLALAVIALVVFQWVSHRIREDQRSHDPNLTARSKMDMFKRDNEVHEIQSDET